MGRYIKRSLEIVELSGHGRRLAQSLCLKDVQQAVAIFRATLTSTRKSGMKRSKGYHSNAPSLERSLKECEFQNQHSSTGKLLSMTKQEGVGEICLFARGRGCPA